MPLVSNGCWPPYNLRTTGIASVLEALERVGNRTRSYRRQTLRAGAMRSSTTVAAHDHHEQENDRTAGIRAMGNERVFYGVLEVPEVPRGSRGGFLSIINRLHLPFAQIRGIPRHLCRHFGQKSGVNWTKLRLSHPIRFPCRTILRSVRTDLRAFRTFARASRT